MGFVHQFDRGTGTGSDLSSSQTEDYVLDGIDLIPLDAEGQEMPSLYKGGPIVRRIAGTRLFRLRNKSGGLIIRRYGNSPSNYYWEVWDPNSHVTKLYGAEFDGEGKTAETQ